MEYPVAGMEFKMNFALGEFVAFSAFYRILYRKQREEVEAG